VAPSLLIDIRPVVGGHGQRGIGRYVKGLAASIATFPDELADRIWAVGFPGPTLDSFGAHAVTCTFRAGLGRLPTWASGPLDTNGALKRSGAGVLHATDPQRPWTGSAISSVVTVYDLIPLHEPAMLRSWRLDHQFAYRWYVRQIRSAARILAISRSTAHDLQARLGIEPERIDVVYPLAATPGSIRRTEPPEPTFLCVGALDVHKQPELAMRAFAHFRAGVGAGRLRYIGPSDALQVRRLSELAAQLGIARSVSFEGRVSDDDLEAAYSTATALVSTSRIEGFGLPPVEAVLRGVPVVAVRTLASMETLEGVAAIVPADPEAIAEAMAHPFTPPEEAVDAIRERHAIHAVARSLADCYRRALD